MGNLSHIEDVEARNAAADEQEMRAAQQALRAAQERTAPVAPQADAVPASDAEPARQAPAGGHEGRKPDAPAAAGRGRLQERPQEHMTAQQEEDFHGLSSMESMGVGQKILIVLAVIVVIAAILYVLNNWLHFM